MPHVFCRQSFVRSVDVVNRLRRTKEMDETGQYGADATGIVKLGRKSVTQARLGFADQFVRGQLCTRIGERRIDCFLYRCSVLCIGQARCDNQHARILSVGKVAEQSVDRLILYHELLVQIGGLRKVD